VLYRFCLFHQAAGLGKQWGTDNPSNSDEEITGDPGDEPASKRTKGLLKVFYFRGREI
jgi:hypothetical protein